MKQIDKDVNAIFCTPSISKRHSSASSANKGCGFCGSRSIAATLLHVVHEVLDRQLSLAKVAN